MKLNKYLGLRAIALGVAVTLLTACGQPGDTEKSAPEAAPQDHAAPAANSGETKDVGGSYNPDGVAPFGMASRQPKEVPPLEVAEAPATDAPAVLADQSPLFATHCASCHGADGMGVEPLGVTLVGSAFVQAKSQDELVAMLKVGRMPGDPDSVKQRVMPGFNWMNDEQLTELAGFLKAQNP